MAEALTNNLKVVGSNPHTWAPSLPIENKINIMHYRQTSTFRSSLRRDSEGLVIVRIICERWYSESNKPISHYQVKVNLML